MSGRHLIGVGLALFASAVVYGQYAVRPADPLGLSIRERRLRIAHAPTPDAPGTSMHLQMWDPWLTYQRGRSYFFREWGRDDGVFESLPDRPEAATANSCGICHNLPFPSAGSGGNVGIRVAVGRSTPHLFGAGLMETLGVQIRAQVMAAHDRNGNGYLDVPEETAGRRATINAAPGVALDFGSLGDEDGNGYPDLNPIFLVRTVDRAGNRLMFDARGRQSRLGDPDIVGYDLAAGVFSSSAGDHQFPSLRTFSIGVFTTIMGIVPEAATARSAPQSVTGGHLLKDWGVFSNAGAFQSEVMLTGNPELAALHTRPPTITLGELDLLEWFLMNHPSPALGAQTDQTRAGRALLGRLGCTECHQPRWQIQPHDPARGLPGDRRFFDLQVRYDEDAQRLEGRLHLLTKARTDRDGASLTEPRRGGFSVEDIFTDLRHHDLGPRFWEYSYIGNTVMVTKKFRTAPLWGAGTTGPYGHDGRSLSLDDVIRRHGGDAEASTRAYLEASESEQAAVLAFLSSLVLYQPELLPTDLDGDGAIADRYRAKGMDLGPEVFRPELLFRVTPRYRGWTGDLGAAPFFSYELLNVPDAYAERMIERAGATPSAPGARR